MLAEVIVGGPQTITRFTTSQTGPRATVNPRFGATTDRKQYPPARVSKARRCADAAPRYSSSTGGVSTTSVRSSTVSPPAEVNEIVGGTASGPWPLRST